MTPTVDDFLQPRSHPGRGLHTQESGDAGLSCNMEHTNDVYTKVALPVAENGSSVTPIPTETTDIGDRPAMPAKLRHDAKPRAHPVFAEGGVELPPVVVVQSTSPPQTQSESPEEEKSKVASITDEEVGEESCSKMAAGHKRPPLAARGGRMSNRLRKRAPGKNNKIAVVLLCLMAFKPLPVSEALPGFCFTCEDKDRCPKLTKIYEPDRGVTPLYQRESNETIPKCSVVLTDVHNCSVCLNKSWIIIIISSQNKIDVEDGNGNIPVIAIDCEQQPTTTPTLQPSKPPSTPPNQTPTTPPQTQTTSPQTPTTQNQTQTTQNQTSNATNTHPSHPGLGVVLWVVIGVVLALFFARLLIFIGYVVKNRRDTRQREMPAVNPTEEDTML